jgi:hypothetical protein
MTMPPERHHPARAERHHPARAEPPGPASVARPVTSRQRTEVLYRAVAAARYAPSAYNAQPWRWCLSGDVLNLFVEPGRMLDVTDPHGRLAVISCGAALHHARLALAAQGWRATVVRRTGANSHGHLARLHLDTVAPTGPGAARLARSVRLRHTDSRPVTGAPLGAEDLRAVTTAFESQGVRLHVLRPDEVLGLTIATARTGTVEPAEAQWHDELALWAGDGRIVGSAKDLRLPASLGVPDRAATFAVLHGPGDQQHDWLQAGEALSAGWLVATALAVSVLPFSAPIERLGADETLRRALPELGWPYLMMRLGRHTTAAAARPTPRLPAGQLIDRTVASGAPERG